MVPLLKTANFPTMYAYERVIANVVAGKNGEPGKVVSFSATPIYSGNSLVPTAVRLVAFSRDDKGKSFYMDVTIENDPNWVPTPVKGRGWKLGN